MRQIDLKSILEYNKNKRKLMDTMKIMIDKTLHYCSSETGMIWRY